MALYGCKTWLLKERNKIFPKVSDSVLFEKFDESKLNRTNIKGRRTE